MNWNGTHKRKRKNSRRRREEKDEDDDGVIDRGGEGWQDGAYLGK